MSAIELTRAGLIRALEAAVAARPAVDAAVRSRAEALAGRIAEAGLEARVLRRGPGDYTVEASGPGLFAREFGAHDTAADPVVAPLLEDPT